MVSARTIIEGVKPLDFGVWQGDKGGKGMVKELRKIGIDWDAPRKEDGDPLLGWGRPREGPSSSPSLVSPSPPTRQQQQQPASASSPSSSKPKIKAKEKKSSKNPSTAKITVLSDSDDSLTGYVSQASSSSSRSNSPSPSDLDEYIEDPTLFAPKKKKVPRPVYLGQLGELLGAKEEPEKLDVALKWGEALIRRKRGFGLELGESISSSSCFYGRRRWEVTLFLYGPCENRGEHGVYHADGRVPERQLRARGLRQPEARDPERPRRVLAGKGSSVSAFCLVLSSPAYASLDFPGS